ncbi:MAG: fused MFS/spermidine synthase [Chitinivibrionales bacterium]
MYPTKKGSWFITALFILSGISGIVYEIIWVRSFGLVFGNTIFASSTVLSVFMTGLALGSWLLGKRIDRLKNALTIYASLELGIGMCGMLVPLCIHGVSPLYAIIYRHFHPSFYQISLIRLFVSFLILIVPCTLMGGTLPVISKFISETFGGMPEKRAGRLYAANTLGSVFGCLISGYFLIGTIGLIGTTAFAVFLNIAIAGVVLIYGKRRRGLSNAIDEKNTRITGIEKDENGPFKKPQIKTVLVLYAISGFLSLFLEVAWTKALVWVMGMDSYAFASMLSVFLFGLALGSFLVSRLAKNMSGAIMKLAVIELLIGLSVLISTALINNMYGVMHNLENTFAITTFWGSFFYLIALAAVIMALPTLLMGMAFPLALKIILNGKTNIGAGVGAVYAANTIGSVFGALLAGFVALPLIGVMRSIVIAGAIFLLVAAILFMAASEYRKTAVNAAAIALAALSFMVMIGYTPDLRDALAQGLNKGEKLLYFKETITGDVQVTESQSADYGRILRIDGRMVASDGQVDVASHKYPAHLMVFLNNRPKSALLIAFGAGGTAGSILRYDEVQRLDVVEICGGVVEPARQYFSKMNNDVLNDPRLHLIIQDGKNFVRLTDQTYDIIYSGPIHPQSNQGSAALYTKDFFEDCRKRLNPGGIHCLWLPMHIPPEDYKVIVKTFTQVYPHSSMWMTTCSPNTIMHTHLIGSNDPLAIDFQRVTEELGKGAVAADQMDYVTLSSGVDFIGQCALGEEKLREFTSDVKHINTDNLPYAEFYRKFGRKIYRQNRECPALILSDIMRYKENALPFVVNVPDSEEAGLEEKAAANYKGDSLRIWGHIRTIQCNVLAEEAKATSKPVDINKAYQYYNDTYRYYSEAQRYLPDDRFLKEFFIEASKARPN